MRPVRRKSPRTFGSSTEAASERWQPSSLLKQLCAGPDGADKPNQYDLRRGTRVARNQSAGEAEQQTVPPAAITIAFFGMPKGRRAGPRGLPNGNQKPQPPAKGLALKTITP